MVIKSITKPIIYKIVFMGDSGVGKSSIATRIACDTFSTFTDATIGASFFGKIIEKNEQLYKFNIWDTAGQEKYSSLVPLYYRNCDAALIVYDITNLESYKKAIARIKELRENSSVSSIIIIGNKSDLDKERMVTSREAKSYCDENDLLFMETSAKNNINIYEILVTLIDKLPCPIKENIKLLQDFPMTDSYRLFNFNCC